MAQLMEIESAQRSLEEAFNRRMGELEAQLHTGGPSKDTVARVADEFRTFRELMFKMLNLLRQQISECQHSVDVMETRHRRKALLFLGVPELDKEDCTKVILDVVNNRMDLRDISSSHVAICHRIGAPSRTERPRPVLLRFSCLAMRASVWKAKGALKGSSFSIREFLTKPRQVVFGKARLQFGMRAVWTQDGNIIVKTPDGKRHKISTADGLDSLVAKYPKASSSAVGSSGGGAGTSNVNKTTRK